MKLKKNKEPFEYTGRWTWLHRLLHDNRGVRYFVVAVALIIATGTGLLAMMAAYKDPVLYDIPVVTLKKPEPKKYYSPLTGSEVPDEAATKRAVTAIMLENSPDARPQSGLKNSGVVFEAVAEGGITRFLALYQQEQPGLIGPVRSLRPYYVDWLAPFNASVAHVGGSYNALQEIRNGQYRDIDQFFNSKTYWRSSDRYAPHNVYTNFERLNALNTEKGFVTSEFTGFVRTAPQTDSKKEKEATKKKKEAPLPTAHNIQVNISSNTYNSSYVYDANSKTYPRNQAGAPHTDREDGQISPRVVIVIKVPTQIGFEDGYREQMQTIGSGEAFIFQNGTITQGTWQKPDKKTQIRFVDTNQKDIPLEPGQTWVTAIAPEKSVTWQ